MARFPGKVGVLWLGLTFCGKRRQIQILRCKDFNACGVFCTLMGSFMVMQPIGTTGRIGGAGEPVHHPSNAGTVVEVPPGEDRASGVRQDDFAPGGHLPEFRPLRRYKEVTERYRVVRVFILKLSWVMFLELW